MAQSRPVGLSDPKLAEKLDDAFGPETTPGTVLGLAQNDELADARRTLDTALAWLQMRLPRVAKGETAEVVKDGRKLYDYQYADLTDVSEAVLPLLGLLGLSWRCRPTMMQLPGETVHRFVLAYRLKHITGDEESGFWPLPDRADPQTVGSAITYARRYCLCAVTGLAPGGDDDGAAAKDASRRGESLDEASALSLPPNETEYLVTLLDPRALTPLAEYPTMWKMVIARRAADKPSPVEHDGKILTWSELFGLSLAQRVAALTTPTEAHALYAEARAAGGDPALPWRWDGQLLSDRLVARGKQIKAEHDQRIADVELAIAEASDLEALAEATERATELSMPDERRASIDAFAEERRQAILRRMQPTPETVARQQAAASSWEEQPGPSPDPEEARSAQELATADQTYDMFASIWKGEPLAAAMGQVDGLFERGEINGDEHAALHAFLSGRPEPGPDRNSTTFLLWQAETAPNPAALNELSDRATALHALRKDLLNDHEKRAVLAAIAARRTALDELEGKRYR